MEVRCFEDKGPACCSIPDKLMRLIKSSPLRFTHTNRSGGFKSLSILTEGGVFRGSTYTLWNLTLHFANLTSYFWKCDTQTWVTGMWIQTRRNAYSLNHRRTCMLHKKGLYKIDIRLYNLFSLMVIIYEWPNSWKEPKKGTDEVLQRQLLYAKLQKLNLFTFIRICLSLIDFYTFRIWKYMRSTLLWLLFNQRVSGKPGFLVAFVSGQHEIH